MKKLLLSISLAFISVLCFANFEKDGYSMFVEDGGIYLSSVIGEVDENLVIPDSIDTEVQYIL